MSRPNKKGLDYFTLDCCLNDKIKLIEAEYGLKGFALVVKLWMKIYRERGYYCEWNDDVALLFMSDMGGNSCVDKKLIDEIIAASIRRDIFSKQLFDKYGILTSRRIQEQYFAAVSRRERVEVKKEYLLVEVDQNLVSVNKNEVNVSRNPENASKNTQSRVEKSRGEYIKENNIKEKPVKSKTVKSEPYFENEEVNEAFLAYLEMRKNSKFPVKTDRQFKILSNKLYRYAGDGNGGLIADKAVAIIDKATVNGWRDFYEVKGSYRPEGSVNHGRNESNGCAGSDTGDHAPSFTDFVLDSIGDGEVEENAFLGFKRG